MQTILRALLLLLLTVAPSLAQSPTAGFLFVTFHDESSPMTEQIYFGLSPDGRQWEALNKEQPVLVSQVGEKGLRDPYIFRSHDGRKTYIVATDLSMNRAHGGGDWNGATHHGSKSIVIWESTDLVHWSDGRLVKVAPDDAGCAWAPEVIYDDRNSDYLIYWASTTGRDQFNKHRIWACKTKDFQTFGAPFIYIEKANHVIDTDIVRADGKYYRFSKNETTKSILMETSDELLGTWREVPGFTLSKREGYEGPECFLLEPAAVGKPATWCLLLDHYTAGTGYEPFLTHDLGSGNFVAAPEIKFPFHFRHGAVLPVTAMEMNRLRAAYGSAASSK